jgi:NAD(P)-dependent dehydrogenase (short-subunit alcohol dehydrogenase family)
VIDLGLTDKRAIVSGAGMKSAGHGRLSALRLAAAGANVACIDINEKRGRKVVDEIVSEGGDAFLVMADMTDIDQVRRAVAEATERLGGIDVGVDIVGNAVWNRVEDLTPEEFARDLNVNLTQVFYLFQTVGQQMIRQGTGGSLLAIASVDGMRAAAMHAPYGAAKAGVISLVKTFAQELGRYGIRVNAVAPGNVGFGDGDIPAGDDQPEGEYAVNGINPLAAPRARDIADAVLFLSSGLASRITGHTLVVDGGATIKEMWGMTDEVMTEMRDQWRG